MVSISKTNLISPNIRVLVLPLVAIIAFAVLTVSIFRIGYSQFSGYLKRLDETKMQITLLEKKLELLREVREEVLKNTDTSLLAVPSVNPALWKASQINSVASANLLVVVNKSVGSEMDGREGLLYETSINYELVGNYTDILDFLIELDNHLPLSTIHSVSFEEESNKWKATIVISVYRGSLPEKLPALNEPIKRLTEDQQQLLDKLIQMKKPEFTVLSPTDPNDREDPFN